MKSEKKVLIVFFVVVFLLFVLGIIYVLVDKGGDVFEEGKNGSSGQVNSAGEVVDVDGNTYKTVKVGEQVWFAENLKTQSSVGNSWCYSDEEFQCEKYGRLYDWEAVMSGDVEPGSQGICPDGWRVPTDGDWFVLESSLAEFSCEPARLSWGCTPSGKALKSSDWEGDDVVGFNILPAGLIDLQGRSGFLLSYAHFWTSTKLGNDVWRRVFLDTQDNILRGTENPEFGYSVRCIKD